MVVLALKNYILYDKKENNLPYKILFLKIYQI
ncbi:hypothetical protein FBBAL38_01850 [Flavobacteria bacterium BAL38]|nr:hypothetical protein FBBAL38_01850 [Flavobacteria bacterium BAL38]